MGFVYMRFKHLLLKFFPKILRFQVLRLVRVIGRQGDLKLNLGSGEDPKFGYINIDRNSSCKPDICGEVLSVINGFKDNSVKEILAIHLINYFSHKKLLEFLNTTYRILDSDCQVIIEGPDFHKIFQLINIREYNPTQLYALFATNFDGPTHDFPYINAVTFDWLQKECLRIGFKSAHVVSPLTHGIRNQRDSRLIAIK